MEVSEIIKKQEAFFKTNKTKDVNFRIEMLKKLLVTIKKYEKEVCDALYQDLHKSEFEAYESEIGLVYAELHLMIKKLRKWSKVKKVHTNIINFPSTSYIYRDPYGIVLIMSPWNYPFQLTMVPLIGSIACGNCTFVKPSNYSLATTNIIEKILSEIYPNDYVSVVRGGREANTTLLDQNFDYVFFTGSPTVGHVVMEACAKHLTPMTLELGGKSPCIVDETADIKLAAKRIVWGKFLNAGQTCIAPDYLLVQEQVHDELIKELKYFINEMYGEGYSSPELPRMISEKHFNRVTNLINTSGVIIHGGTTNKETLQISPTLLDKVSLDDPVMGEEIFGPVLPIMTFKNIHEVYDLVNSRPKPLALYYFTKNKKREKECLSSVSFGGGCINDTIIHITNDKMPFGGVGNSGMGKYHGKYSFETFSHEKSVIKKHSYDVFLRYPPFKDHLKYLKKLMK